MSHEISSASLAHEHTSTQPTSQVKSPDKRLKNKNIRNREKKSSSCFHCHYLSASVSLKTGHIIIVTYMYFLGQNKKEGERIATFSPKYIVSRTYFSQEKNRNGEKYFFLHLILLK